MYNKLYLFCIGGTGSRVLNSLTMLLSAGVQLNAKKVVPVVIDTDIDSGNLTDAINNLKSYCEIRKNLSFDDSVKNKFFSTEIDLSSIRLSFPNTDNKRFDEFISFNNLSKEAQAFTSILFSEKNLNSDMVVGFKGNPNIGSVVLNQFQHMDDFINLMANFEQGDRIFVISSIFGGTGASGFPLLVKNLRTLDPSIPNQQLVQDSPIGAISVLPYFQLQPSADSAIDSSTFISKTTAALTYYDRSLNEENVHYYIGDTVNNQYDNCEGGNFQKNSAHVIELISALAVLDFDRISDDDDSLQVSNGTPNNPVYKEFGLEDSQELIFKNFDTEFTRPLLQSSLTKFLLMEKYLNEHKIQQDEAWFKSRFSTDFLTSAFYGKLKQYTVLFAKWLKELSQNKRSFSPFELDEHSNALFDLVKEVKPGKVMKFSSNYDLYNDYLNEAQQKIPQGKDDKTTFVEMFYTATEKLGSDKKIL